MFKDNQPSVAWVYRFLARHPELSSRVPEDLGHERAHINKAQILKWFESQGKFLKEEHELEAAEFLTADNASKIYNLDESGFPFAGTNSKLNIFATKGAKNVYKLAPTRKNRSPCSVVRRLAGILPSPLSFSQRSAQSLISMVRVEPGDCDLRTSQNGWM